MFGKLFRKPSTPAMTTVYPADHVTAAREAFLAYKHGDVDSARGILISAGLSLEDMRAAHKQYLAEVLDGSRPSPF